jgi:uncharacterized membrane protein YdbT with pleckstrin-like domain
VRDESGTIAKVTSPNRDTHRRRLRQALLIWVAVSAIFAVLGLPQVAAVGILVVTLWAWHDRRQMREAGRS